MNGNLLIKGGRLIDPANGIDDQLDLLVQDGKVGRIGKDLPAAESTETMDASGRVVCPGLIDVHVHLRVPGQEHKETIATGTLAAVRGGFTAVCCMPNTSPPLHSRAEIEHVLRRNQEEGHCRVYPVAAASRDLKHETLVEMADVKEAGAVAVCDDAYPIQNPGFLRRMMYYATMVDLPVVLHCEDKGLSDGGVMNEGYVATLLGLKGIPRTSQEIAVSRSLRLAQETNCRIHIQHVSTRGEVELIQEAKSRGTRVTTEVCPHHFSMTDEACITYDSNTKMNHPLRTQDDVDAVIEGLKDGTIDCIATDHAPHALEEKEVEFDAAPFGIVGLETALGLSVCKLVDPGHLTLPEVIAKLTAEPAKCMGIPGGSLGLGDPADITIFNPNSRWTVDAGKLSSLSKNMPFHGWELPAHIHAVLVEGSRV